MFLPIILDTRLNYTAIANDTQSYSSGITNTVNNNNIKNSISNNNKIDDNTITDDIYKCNSNYSYNDYDRAYDVDDKYEDKYENKYDDKYEDKYEEKYEPEYR